MAVGSISRFLFIIRRELKHENVLNIQISVKSSSDFPLHKALRTNTSLFDVSVTINAICDNFMTKTFYVLHVAMNRVMKQLKR
jgi:hypothetical protein